MFKITQKRPAIMQRPVVISGLAEKPFFARNLYLIPLKKWLGSATKRALKITSIEHPCFISELEVLIHKSAWQNKSPDRETPCMVG